MVKMTFWPQQYNAREGSAFGWVVEWREWAHFHQFFSYFWVGASPTVDIFNVNIIFKKWLDVESGKKYSHMILIIS